MRLVPLTMTCGLPACSITIGVAQEVTSLRSTFHRSSPVRLSRATTNDCPSWSQLTIERVAMKRRRASLAVAVQRLHRSEVGFPDQLAVQVEAIEPERAKLHKEMLAVGHGRVRRQAARVVTLLVRQRLAQRLLPEDLAAGPVDRQGHKLVAVRDGKIVVIARCRARPRRAAPRQKEWRS